MNDRVTDAIIALLSMELTRHGVDTVPLPWDMHQEVDIVDPMRARCEAPADLDRAMAAPFLVGYFMHYDRDDNRRWYGHTNWRLNPESNRFIQAIEAQEGI